MFYFGNLIGETGDSPTTLRVTALDLSATRRAVMTTRGSVDIQNPFDMDRSGTLTASVDLSVVRANRDRSLPALVAPAAGPATASSILRRSGVWEEATSTSGG